MMIAQGLNRTLPEDFIAEPQVHLGSSIEIDVATHEEVAPPEPTLAIATDRPDADEYEVRVYDTRSGRRLVAAVEIVSPADKDRPEHRRAFVAKCSALLQNLVCAVIVDLVTTRTSDLYQSLLEFLGQAGASVSETPDAPTDSGKRDSREGEGPAELWGQCGSAGASPSQSPESACAPGTPLPLYAVSCRWTQKSESWFLETWAHALRLGEPLPILPLWISDGQAVPLDLEQSYEETCRALRIP